MNLGDKENKFKQILFIFFFLSFKFHMADVSLQSQG